ncbi:MatE [Phytophthora infestans]|uniref:MatE n=1 Tax=Phytophthora infestans TaxID=4787 RepID=A0A8S9UIU1_PHYIN|nr:MatE [Phytophthora infestans]
MDSPYTQQYVDAATLSTMLLNLTNYSICFGLSSALDTLCSQAYGAKRYDKIGVYFQAGVLVLAAVFGPIFLLNWYTESVVVSLGQDEEISKLAQTFSRWMLVGMPFVVLYKLVRKVLQAQNIMKTLVTIATIGNVVNIITGYVLAYHTPMGFDGRLVEISGKYYSASTINSILLLPPRSLESVVEWLEPQGSASTRGALHAPGHSWLLDDDDGVGRVRAADVDGWRAA